MVRALAERISGNRAYLSQDELHHLLKVLRRSEGDRVEVIAPEGGRYHSILRRDGSEWFAEILESVEASAESPLDLVLAQALIKKDKFEWVIQKSVELGVREIVPLVTHRTEVRLDEKRAKKKMGRWERIVVEAVKQCGRDLVPELHPPTALSQFLEREAASGKLIFDEEAVDPLSSLIERMRERRRIVVLIGPEGGWDPIDRKSISSSESLCRARMGPRILRTETAAVAALSIVQYLLGDLDSGPDSGVSPISGVRSS